MVLALITDMVSIYIVTSATFAFVNLRGYASTATANTNQYAHGVCLRLTSMSFAHVDNRGTAHYYNARTTTGVHLHLISVSFTTVDYNGSASYRIINTVNGVQPFHFRRDSLM